MRFRLFKWILLGLAILLVPLGAGAWMLLRVEDIPDELPPVELDPAAIVIPGVAGEPPLSFAQLRGKTTFFVLVGPWTGSSDEGEELNRALNRWEYPETTQGYIIGDAEGFGVFAEKISEAMQHFGKETRVPLYVDFEGIFVRTFNLPKGHHGFVVMGPDGEIVMRRSGGVPADELDEVMALLGAKEPPPGPEAPLFQIGGIQNDDCDESACIFVFIARPIELQEIPGVEGGFEGDEEEAFEKMFDPSLRNLALARRMDLDEGRGVFIGQVPTELELHGWHRMSDDEGARQAFEIPEDEAAVVVVDHGRIQIRETGLVPLYRWGTVADRLGIELNDRKPLRE